MPTLDAGLERLLQFAALILSILNGLILIRVHIRDRAKLDVAPVHPDVYQWWFRLPDSTYQGEPSRAFGFLGYVGIVNRGYRSVTVNRWRLHIRARNWRRMELRAISIPEPTLTIGPYGKVLPVLGQIGRWFEGRTHVEAGSSISGTVFYVYQCYGHDVWNPQVRNGEITGHFAIRDVFGGRAGCSITFRERTLEYIKSMIPDIDKLLYTDESKVPKPQ